VFASPEGVHVRTATDDDWADIWPIWQTIVAAGETYAWSPDTANDEARRLWMLPPPAEVVVLEDGDGKVRASAVVKPNQSGPGDHVANASFMVDPSAQGQGLGRHLAGVVLDRARAAGYSAMQFNAVVSTNVAAIRLWQSLGFEIVGTIPSAFRHPRLGLVDLHVMHRIL
jgi:L-amino acid N-acyltransferase YncA